MQRDGIVKSLEELILQAQLAFHARQGAEQSRESGAGAPVGSRDPALCDD
jgi:hypothetical protein